MKTETQIAKENVNGLHKEYACNPNYHKCKNCEIRNKAKAHLSTLTRWLDFLDNSGACGTCRVEHSCNCVDGDNEKDKHEKDCWVNKDCSKGAVDKISDIKSAIEIYKEAGVTA